MGFLLLMMLGVSIAATLLTSSDGEGAEDGATPDPAEDRDVQLRSGEANPKGGAGNDTFSGIVEGDVRGGAGDDSFSFDNGYGAVLSGGAGNDSFEGSMGDSFTLYGGADNDLFAFDTDVFEGAKAYAGAGNDRFDLEIMDSDVQPGPLLSGGTGADSYDLTFAPGDADSGGPGKLVTITDFKQGEDRLDIDSRSNTQEVSIIDGGDGDDRLNIDIALTDPSGQRMDTVSGGTGADVFTLDLANVTYGNDFSLDQMLTIGDLNGSEDDILIDINPEDAPFYKGAELVQQGDGTTDLVLTFEKADASGALRQWTGIIKLLDARDLTLADDGPILIRTAA